MSATPLPADPRPTLIGRCVDGSRCPTCGHASARSTARCERCLADTHAAQFGPNGVVWAAATVHLRVGDRTPPFVLAYVDLDDGPRVLARVESGEEIPAGDVVSITGESDGDLLVERAHG